MTDDALTRHAVDPGNVDRRGGDLLDMLAELDEPTTPVFHALMPWMAPACGTVSACGGNCGGGCPPQSSRHRFITTYADVTCPDCLACGDLSALARESQRPGRMAGVVQ